MKITPMKTMLRVQLEGREQVFALRAKIDIPRKSILSVEWKDVFRDWKTWEVRIPGTGLPGVLFAGSYWTEDGWDFMYVKRPQGWRKPVAYGVLVIETDLARYRRVLITFPQKDSAEIVKWFGE